MQRTHKYLFVALSLLFIGCGSSDTPSESPVEESNTTQTIQEDINVTLEDNATLLERLNFLRVQSGLIALSENSLLTQSALNHAIYLDENSLSGHYESSSDSYFTGYASVDRALYVGYESRGVSENVSTGQESESLSLDGLMGAIYHRFGFLSFEINEIGYAKSDKAYVYNMGNSDLNTLCSGESFSGSGEYYYSVCRDESFRIESSIYKGALNTTINANAEYVIYPYSNEANVTPAFYEESPDPLPEFGVSGLPISVEFNPNEYDMSKFSLTSFSLEDENSLNVALVSYEDGTTIMKKENDVNAKLSEYQFVIFPYERLDYNQTYHAKFAYTYDGEAKEIAWSFQTKSLENLLVYNYNNLDLSLNKRYYIYIKPEDKNDVITTINTNCSYEEGGTLSIENAIYDKNTIELTIFGTSVQSCELTYNSNKTISLNMN